MECVPSQPSPPLNLRLMCGPPAMLQFSFWLGKRQKSVPKNSSSQYQASPHQVLIFSSCVNLLLDHILFCYYEKQESSRNHEKCPQNEFIEKKQQVLPFTVLPPIQIPSKYLLSPHQPDADGPTRIEVQTQLVLNQPQVVAVDKQEPPNPEPPDNDVLTREDFLGIMENFKKESLDLLKLKLPAFSLQFLCLYHI